MESAHEGVEASDSRATGTQSVALYCLQSWRVAESLSRPRAEAAIDIEVRDGDSDAPTAAASRHNGARCGARANEVTQANEIFFRTLWCKGQTQADTLTIRLGATTCGVISNPPPSSSPFLHPMAFLPQPSQFILAWDRRQICWLAYPVATNKTYGMQECTEMPYFLSTGACVEQWDEKTNLTPQ